MSWNYMSGIAQYKYIIDNLASTLCDKYGRPKNIDILGDENVWLWPIDINSYVVSLDQIICALVNDISKECFLSYYDYCMDKYHAMEEIKYNLYHYWMKYESWKLDTKNR